MKVSPLRIVVLLLGSLLLLAGALLPKSVRDSTSVRKTVTMNTIAQVVSALKTYQADYGNLPPGTPAEIMRALRGDNPHHTFYFEAPAKSFNEKGELIDSWGTAVRIESDASHTPRVSSAGKNKVFDGDVKGSDDIRSWD